MLVRGFEGTLASSGDNGGDNGGDGFASIAKVDFVFSDWGTAVSLAKEPSRRMTLNGPGTDGYIAPETKSARVSSSSLPSSELLRAPTRRICIY